MSADPMHEELISRIRRDMLDSWDEEIEMDVEDYHLLPHLPDGGANRPVERDYRRNYIQQLFRLQAELVKLQDWVAPCPPPTTASARSGTSSAMSRTSPRRAKSCCSTAAGTTAPASNT